MKPLSPTDLTYNSYLKVPELLTLQVPLSEPPHHDELLFIVIHQTYELWFSLVLHEFEKALEHMEQGQVLRAHHFVRRVVAIQKVLLDQIHILETMSPIDFLSFRDRLNPASGFQSVQFREVEFMAGLKDPAMVKYFETQPAARARLEARLAGKDLRQAFYELLHRLGLPMPPMDQLDRADDDPQMRVTILAALESVYAQPEDNLPLYLLCEALIELDEYLGLWRYHHCTVVERIIGRKKGTGGSEGVAYLMSTITKRCFPLLWEVRQLLGLQTRERKGY